MDTKELVERLRKRIEIETWYEGGLRHVSELNPDGPEAADAIERLERERDRYRSGLEVLATSFYKDDQHQDYAKHVLGDAQISAESELTTLRARVAKMEEALKMARIWLEGWASAERELPIIDAALEEPTS